MSNLSNQDVLEISLKAVQSAFVQEDERLQKAIKSIWEDKDIPATKENEVRILEMKSLTEYMRVVISKAITTTLCSVLDIEETISLSDDAQVIPIIIKSAITSD